MWAGGGRGCLAEKQELGGHVCMVSSHQGGQQDLWSRGQRSSLGWRRTGDPKQRGLVSLGAAVRGVGRHGWEMTETKQLRV